MTFYFSLWHPTDHVLCEDGWDLADLQLVHSIRRSSSPHIHGHAQVGSFTFWFCCRVEEGSKSRQEEGDIKEKLLHSKMDKDLVSRNEKVQVQVNDLLVFISNISKTSFQLGFSGSAPALQGCQNEEFEKCRQAATAEVFQRLCCPCHPLRLNLDNSCSLFYPVFTLVYFGIGILHAETV